MGATGLDQQPYLGRWLLLVAAMVGASALVYACGCCVRRHRMFVDGPDVTDLPTVLRTLHQRARE